jgi:hypothetical protein
MLSLAFEASGDFSATWRPFETRQDFWGTYRFDTASGTLTLIPTDGPVNYKPADLKPAGRAQVDRQRLVLRNLWLGTPPPGLLAAGARPSGPACGHVLSKRPGPEIIGGVTIAPAGQTGPPPPPPPRPPTRVAPHAGR